MRELCKHHQVTLTPHGRGRARAGFVAYDHLLGGGIADTGSGDGATPQLSAPPPVHLHPDTLEPMLEPREATDDAHDPTEDEPSPILAGGSAPALPRPRGRRRAWRTCLHPDTLQPLEDEPSPRSSPTPATPGGNSRRARDGAARYGGVYTQQTPPACQSSGSLPSAAARRNQRPWCARRRRATWCWRGTHPLLPEGLPPVALWEGASPTLY